MGGDNPFDVNMTDGTGVSGVYTLLWERSTGFLYIPFFSETGRTAKVRSEERRVGKECPV